MWDVLLTVAGILMLICLWFILYDSNRFVVRRHSFTDARIKRPYRLVMFSDLHNKCFGPGNEKLLEAIDKLQPEGIFIPGDVLTAKPGKKLTVSLELLTKLSEKYLIYYSDGNHEHRLELYQDVYGSMAEEYEAGLKKAGIRRLNNASTALAGTGIKVYGLKMDPFYYRRFRTAYMPPSYLKSVLGEKDEKSYGVLLAHNPDYFPEYAAWGADLVFSGHVHGGMVRIPGWRGVVSPSVRLFPKYDGGLFREGKSTMLLSRGLGMHTIPIRLFNPGELLYVELLPADEKEKQL